MRRVTSVLAVASVSASRLGLGASECPVESCKKGADSFLEVKAKIPSSPMKIDVESQTPCVIGPSPPTYDVKFKPGHFTCMECDVGTCEDCSVICDLSKCIGQFYTQECWCRTKQAQELHPSVWGFRKEDSNNLVHGSVQKFFCDTDCTGGICDTDTLQCGKREDVCEPWWYCNEDPSGKASAPPPPVAAAEPVVPALVAVSEHRERISFRGSKSEMSTESSSQGSLAKGKANQTALKSRRSLLQRIRGRARTIAQSKIAGEKSSNDMPKMRFEPGRFVCESGSLPPKVWDPDQMMFGERGYIVFDKGACSGGVFEQKCYCWDNFKYLRGEDPLTSEFACDDTCGWGTCEGRTCGKEPPGPLPPHKEEGESLSIEEATPEKRESNMATPDA